MTHPRQYGSCCTLTKNRTEVELATLTWVDWYNNRRLLERLGHIPPAEAEKAYYASIGNDDLAA
ncbi:transposase [Escherichia coli]|nr:transposase [Escherichia coli]KSX95311.1 transposase [Escherichia coli]KUR85818.1 transposase [Escherichia coli]KUS24292.1 transposase [Escherichia coli]KUS28295.1 transposase [Escherichia coli]